MHLLATSPTAIETASSLRIHLPCGLIGLPDLRHFDLSPAEDAEPFLFLRSRDEAAIEFVAVEPCGLFPDYCLEVREEDAETLQLDGGQDPLVLNLLTIRSLDPQHVTANLKAPLVVNRRRGVGRQVVLANAARYSATYPLIERLA